MSTKVKKSDLCLKFWTERQNTVAVYLFIHRESKKHPHSLFVINFGKRGPILIILLINIIFSDELRKVDENLPPRQQTVAALPCETWMFNCTQMIIAFYNDELAAISVRSIYFRLIVYPECRWRHFASISAQQIVIARAKRLAQHWTTRHRHRHRRIHWQSGAHDAKHACVLMADILGTCCNIVN